MSVHKDERNPKKWVVVYKNRKKRGFDSKREAINYESKLKLNNSDMGCNNYFYDVAVMYFDDLHLRTSYATYSKNLARYKRYIKPNFTNKRLSLITVLDCKKFYDKLSGYELHSNTKNEILNLFKRIFLYASKYLSLKINPSTQLDNFKMSSDERLLKHNKELNVWSIDEFNKFIDCVKIPKYKTLFYVLFYTGIRLGEAQALQWKDYYNGLIDVYKSYTVKTDKGIYEIKTTKTLSSIRKVSLPNFLISILDNYKASISPTPGFNGDWFIFGNINPLPRTNIERVKSKAIKESGVKRIKIHDFRHSHASNLIASGVNIVAVSKRLGHSDINMTLKVYTHLMNKSEDELLNILEKNFPKSSP